MKSYVNSFLEPTCDSVMISINKLQPVPDKIVADLIVGVFRNGGVYRVVVV